MKRTIALSTISDMTFLGFRKLERKLARRRLPKAVFDCRGEAMILPKAYTRLARLVRTAQRNDARIEFENVSAQLQLFMEITRLARHICIHPAAIKVVETDNVAMLADHLGQMRKAA